ncbi:MAG: 1-deoxy-D-xylulose-5-phosphate synthase [Lachnospiraceae bacterium]|nr:1-deoxy-D-xylulose-5-phosphate synthase [Lachnospiraceae bacterium]
MVLADITKENDIKKLPPSEYESMAAEIRQFLLEHVSKTGGHLASNLGAVELTMALHLSLDLPKDKIIWDVGHQSYTHKILTGRAKEFDTLRQFHGLSGFPKRKESDCDCFDTGHSSTSISAAVGMAKARDLRGSDETIVAVIGDGSMTGGMAYEALNNAARLKSNLIIILNDNDMSISENVGGLHKYLDMVRTGDTYLNIKDKVTSTLLQIPDKGEEMVDGIRRVKNGIKHMILPGSWFEELGITYLGPGDGHDIPVMLRFMEEARKAKGAVVIHVLTQKGRGYEPAEKNPSRFHGPGPFDIATGKSLDQKTYPAYTDVFSGAVCKLGELNPKVVAITAAMADGTGLNRFQKRFPKRFFDVGIAEQHAVTFAAGLAVGGYHPVVAIYSSFLQRAYDQILHDVCIQNLPVVFAVDRAGIVGSDGETHQGVFDYSYLSSLPNMHILAPKNDWELAMMMKFSVEQDGPVAVRYPRGRACQDFQEFTEPIIMGKCEVLHQGSRVVIFAVGSMVEEAMGVRSLLLEKGLDITVVNGRFIKPIDERAILVQAACHDLLVTMEDNVLTGGYGAAVGACLMENGVSIPVYRVGVPDQFIEHGSIPELKRMLRIDAESVAQEILRRLSQTDRTPKTTPGSEKPERDGLIS